MRKFWLSLLGATFTGLIAMAASAFAQDPSGAETLAANPMALVGIMSGF